MVIVSANGSEVGKQMIEDGTLLGTVGWSPSENAILLVLKALEYLNGTPEAFFTPVPMDVYHEGNLDRYSNWSVEDMAKKYEPIFKERGYWNQ